MHLRLRTLALSGWVPASILAVAAIAVLHAYSTPILQIAIFGVYVSLGIAVPGMLWLRLLRGRPAHIAEDLALGLAVGYCVEIATYVPARAIGVPLLFVLWPISTLVLFTAVPSLRRCWRGGGARVSLWWSWSVAAILAYLLFYSGQTFFAWHHLSGTDTPYVDMPFHLALIGELRNHVPPQVPYVPGVPLAYHWFFYAEAAATSWATGIDPVILLYRLSGLPMLGALVVLTAAAAQRLTGRWWAGPLAVAVALFGAVAGPYRWAISPVPDTQQLWADWLSPTNLFGLALLAAIIVAFMDLLQDGTSVPRKYWLMIGLLVAGAAGAKATILPILIVGLFAVVAGVAIGRRALHKNAATGLAIGCVALLLAAVLIYKGAGGGLVIGLNALRVFSVVQIPGAEHATGISSLIMPIVGLLVALLLWSFMWAGAYGLLARRRESIADPRILLLVGICAGGLGAATVLLYPSMNQWYYLLDAAGAFGLLTAAGIAAVVPARARYLPLMACGAVAALMGAAAVLAVGAIGPATAPALATAHLSGVMPAIMLPVLGLLGVAVAAYVLLRLAAHKRPALKGAVPLLVIALVMGFSLPDVAAAVVPPPGKEVSGIAVPADGIQAARWLRDHSNPDDLVATNLHCRKANASPFGRSCDSRQFWVSGYSERHILVEGWAYTAKTTNAHSPFWNTSLLVANDAAFTDPSAATITKLRDEYGVRWLFAYLPTADSAAIGRNADLRYRAGDFAVYEMREP